MQSVDVAIVGGGMVGLAVACGLQGSGLRVAVLEKAEPRPLAADAPPALRVTAINAASEKLLTKLDIFARDLVPPSGPAAITVWKCGIKAALATLASMTRAWALATLAILSKMP